MKFLKYLKEEFVGSRQAMSYSGGNDIEFFSNPTSKEMKTVVTASPIWDNIRFYVDSKKKKVIIWEGGCLHKEAMKAFNSKLIKNFNKILYGTAKYVTGKMEIESVGGKNSDYESLMKEYHKHKSWLPKYFTNMDNIPSLLDK